MGYTMVFYVDGGCRNNGYSNAIGAAAAVQMLRGGGHRSWYRQIYDNPTNQRAEITAIIIALQDCRASQSIVHLAGGWKKRVSVPVPPYSISSSPRFSKVPVGG